MKAGWQGQRLASVAVKITDGSHNPPKGGAESDFLMLSSKNVFDDDLHYAEPRYLNAEQYQQEDKRTGIAAGDVLLTIVGTVGRSAVVPTDAPRITLQRSVAVIRPKRETIDSRFLMYSFINRSSELNEKARGVAQKGIYLETLRELEVMFPPLPEQHRIVAILDETFDGIATAKANAEKNLQNARTLFESHLESVFTQSGPGWVDATLGKVCDLQNGYAFKSSDYVNSSNTLNIRMSSIRPGGNFDSEHNQRFLPDSYAKDYAAFLLREGDLIIAMTDMASDPKILGVPTLVGSLEGRNFLMNQRVGKLFGFSTHVRSPYLRYFLTSPSVRQFYKSKGAGGLQINISKGDILSVKIPLPDVAQQDRVIEQLDALAEETQRLEFVYQQKMTALDDLKKSLLQQAFSGAL